MESFSKAVQDIFAKMYQQANPNGAQGFDPNAGQNPGSGANVHDDGTVESEFTD